jgi:DNA-binding CsgD family transcriptional regulator
VASPALADLLERDRELVALDAALDRVPAGGRVVVIEGAAGIGKTRLLQATRERVSGAGLATLTARCGERERGFPFGVVRQLFEPPLRAASDEARARWLSGAARFADDVLGNAPPAEPAGPDARFARLHGLYWLCAALAEEQPLLLAVDDAHWADEPSLEFLDFLARRLDELPVLVVVAARSSEPGASPLLSQLATDPAATVLHPEPLTDGAVGMVVREALGDDAALDFCTACRTATGGNPLLLNELLREIAAERIAPTSVEAGRVAALAPRGVSRLVLLRLARLPARAGGLAQALAVLGEAPQLEIAAELAGLDEAAADEFAAALVRADVLAADLALTFVHPVVRAAVYEDIPPPIRKRMHADAARLLAGRGVRPLELAPHLLATDPVGEPATVELLRAAGADALALGDPATAVSYLERALAEPPPDDALAGALAELGVAQTRTGSREAIDHLTRAVALTQDGAEAAARRLELARVLKFAGRPVEAVELLRVAEQQLGPGDHELGEAIRVELLSSGQMSAAARELVAADVHRLLDSGERPRTFLERFTLVALAWERTASCEATADQVGELADRALEGAGLPADIRHGGHALGLAATVLLFSERFERAEGLATEALEAGRCCGSALEVFNWLATRATIRCRLGHLLGAEEDATAALDLAGRVRGSESIVGIALAARLDVAFDRGANDEELQAAIDRFLLPADTDGSPSSQAMRAYAQLLGERGEPREGLRHLAEVAARGATWGSGNPAMLAWRSTAALLQHRLGKDAEARRLAAEEVELARRFGAPRAVGVALRAAGLVTGGRRGIELLREAVAALESSPAELERARALIDLGAALRRTGQRAAARDPLHTGLELAVRSGATRLAERAAVELRASGARPRRTARSGDEALTPAERRVAELAAQGLSNRDAAQALFVSTKTVETHLGHAYAKLGIRSRRDLAGALGAPGDA